MAIRKTGDAVKGNVVREAISLSETPFTLLRVMLTTFLVHINKDVVTTRPRISVLNMSVPLCCQTRHIGMGADAALMGDRKYITCACEVAMWKLLTSGALAGNGPAWRLRNAHKH